jgi:copper transport protein
MKRLVAACVAALLLVAAGPALLGPAATTHAHAQLVSSEPSAGQRLDEAPTAVALVFSERIDQLGTSADVLDAQGKTVVSTGGTVEPSDPYRLTIPLPVLADGLYSVQWRSLSADDGHSSEGFFTFGVGNVDVPTNGQQTGGGAHAGHGLVQAALETIGRALADLGTMLAIGLVVILLLVVAPVLGMRGMDDLRRWPAYALLVAGAGAALMIPLVAQTAGVETIAYATTSRSGQLLVVRALVAIAASLLALALDRRSLRLGLAAAFVGGSIAALLVGASGHAAAFGALAPIPVAALHVAAAGSWLAGLVVMAWLIVRRRSLLADRLGQLVTRFTAVALVSVAIFGLTGIYLAWLMQDGLVDATSDFGLLLIVKSAVVIAGLAIGALNFLAWRNSGPIGITSRIPLEATAAVAVVLVTALLASSSPPAPTQPIPISRAASSAAAELDATLGILPGRPGPNRLIVSLARPPTGPNATVQLVLTRRDIGGETRLDLSPANGQSPPTTFGTDTLLPAGSSWDASVRLVVNGTEQSRARFAFALDDNHISSGVASPPVDPLLLISIALGAAAVLMLTLALAGAALPRADRTASRLALLAGGVAASAVAVAAILFGP